MRNTGAALLQGEPRPNHAPIRTATPTYLPALDGLRAVSILLVVVSHLGLSRLVPGAFGVTLFFFISGYLITRQLYATLHRTGRIGLAGFYYRRALRLMPAGLLYIGVAGLAFQAAGGLITPAGWFAALLYGANYYDLWEGYRSTLPGVRHPFNILWSLAIEEHFYAIWPLLLTACIPRIAARPTRAILLILALCIAVLLWRLWLLHACFAPHLPLLPAYCGPPNPNPLWQYNRLYLATDTRLDSIAWGALLALLQAENSPLARPTTTRAVLGLVLLAIGFALPGPLGRHVLRGTLQGIAMLGLLPWLLAPATWPSRALSWPPAVLLGRLSYSLYLWHWAALGVADYFAPQNHPAWLAIAVPLSLLLACASYWGVERPMLRFRRRAGSHAPVA